MTSIDPPKGMPRDTVAERQAAERGIAIQCIADLLQAGYSISVHDGEEMVVRRSFDPSEIIGAMFSTDEDYLIPFDANGRAGFVRFIYGNDGWDVINDYTTNLEEVIAPTMLLVDQWEEKLNS